MFVFEFDKKFIFKGLAAKNGKPKIAQDGYPYTTLMYANGPGAPVYGERNNLTGVKTGMQ